MHSLLLTIYLGIGLVAAGFTIAVFPPRPGYHPPIGTCILAVSSFILFWPMLVLMALGYWCGRLYRRWSGEEPSTPVVSSPRPHYRVLYDDLKVRSHN